MREFDYLCTLSLKGNIFYQYPISSYSNPLGEYAKKMSQKSSRIHTTYFCNMSYHKRKSNDWKKRLIENIRQCRGFQTSSANKKL